MMYYYIFVIYFIFNIQYKIAPQQHCSRVLSKQDPLAQVAHLPKSPPARSSPKFGLGFHTETCVTKYRFCAFLTTALINAPQNLPTRITKPRLSYTYSRAHIIICCAAVASLSLIFTQQPSPTLILKYRDNVTVTERGVD